MGNRPALLGLLVTSVVLLLMTAVGLGCNRGSQREDRLVVGAVLPLTGEISEYGQRVKKGMDLAAEQIKAAWKTEVDVLYEDDAGSAKLGVAAASRLVARGVRFIIGSVSSSVTLSILPVTERAGVLLFSPASSSPRLTGAGQLFVRNWPSDVLEAAQLAAYAFGRLGVRRVVILYVNNDYGLGLQEQFAITFREMGGVVSSVEAYPLDSRDFRSLAAKYRADFSTIDAFYLAGYHRDMAYATRELRSQGYKGVLLADADYGIPEVLEIAGDAANGTVFASPTYDPQSNQTARRFAVDFTTRYGLTPSQFEANGFDALQLIYSGASQHGRDPASVAAWIRQLKGYEGAAGILTFTEGGDVIKPISIMRVWNGSFETIEKFTGSLDAPGGQR